MSTPELSRELYDALTERLSRDESCAVATIVDSSGSIPNAVGAQMLVDADGRRIAGTVGGGAIEYRAQNECAAAIADGRHRRFSAFLTDEEAGGIGMMCGGKAEIFVQVFCVAPQLVLVGAGHINLELSRIAGRLGYRVAVIDDRAEWANADNYPDARCFNLEPAEAYAEIAWSSDSFVVIGTRDRDLPALRAAVGQPCRYIGVVASKRKALMLLRKLDEEGTDIAQLAGRLFAPIGLDTGGRAPADIAVSVIAEIQQIRHGRAGGHLAVGAEEIAAIKRRRSAG